MGKIKLYLDTNTILDFFINQAKYFKNKGELKIPEKTKFMLDNLEKFDFVISFLTKAEIMRELVAAHHVDPRRVDRFWADFMESMNNPKYVSRFEFDEKLVELAGKSKMKLRTMFNFQHLFIAMKEDAYFVSGDKDAIEKIKELGVYNKVLTYIELRSLIS